MNICFFTRACLDEVSTRRSGSVTGIATFVDGGKETKSIQNMFSVPRYVLHVCLAVAVIELALYPWRSNMFFSAKLATQIPRCNAVPSPDASAAGNDTADGQEAGESGESYSSGLRSAAQPQDVFRVFERGRLHKGPAFSRHVLTIAQPLWDIDANGLVRRNRTNTTHVGPALVVPPDTTRVCVDVGTYIHSPTSRKWWASDPKAFVIAVEANPFSQFLLSKMAHPQFVYSTAGYWPNVPQSPSMLRQNATYSCSASELSDCIVNTWGHAVEHADRFLLLPMAAGFQSTMLPFQLGTPGRPDSGSVLDFRQSFKKKRGIRRLAWHTVAAGKLADILALTPAALPGSPTAPLMWDTLKIDAQGFDSLVIHGAGDLLAHFVCVIGEFDKRAYAGGPHFNHHSFLVFELGFAMVHPQLYVNRRFAAALFDRLALCNAPDVPLSWSKIRKTLLRYNGMFGPWEDSVKAVASKEQSQATLAATGKATSDDDTS